MLECWHAGALIGVLSTPSRADQHFQHAPEGVLVALGLTLLGLLGMPGLLGLPGLRGMPAV